MAPDPLIVSIEDLAARIPDGSTIALPPDYSGCAMSAVKALIRRGVRDLRLIAVPSLGFQADWLIGAGCVASVDAAAMTLDEFGLPPQFGLALKERRIEMKDSTCPAIHAGLQAAEKGIPFIPLRGILGSDLLKYRRDWQVIDNPFSDESDPIVLVPAIRPDFALFHARAADVEGNVWIGVRRELMLMAHAARTTLVTVERIEDRNFLNDDAFAAGTIPSLYISAVAIAVRGADPVGLAGAYDRDDKALSAYVGAARTRQGFQAWLDEHVLTRVPA